MKNALYRDKKVEHVTTTIAESKPKQH